MLGLFLCLLRSSGFVFSFRFVGFLGVGIWIGVFFVRGLTFEE